jgi:exodeoxyribonuclease VIII
MESLNNTTPHITSVDIDEQVYRSDGAIAASDLKYAIDHGLEAFNIYKYGKNNPPRIATPAMKFGSMCHKYCLEPQLFQGSYALLDDKRTKTGKATALALQEKGIETFTTPEMDTLTGIYKALCNNEFANKYIISDTLRDTRGLAEQSYWWKHRETGLQCKCRCDYVIDDMVIDLKTTGESGSSPEAFTKTIVNFKYYLQAAHYLQGTGQKRFIFVAVEKVHPFSVGVYELSPHFIERGYELQEQALSDIKQAQESGIWKGYTNYEPEGIKTLTPPKWL